MPPETPIFRKGTWQKVYTNHANQINATEIEDKTLSMLAHIEACKLILSKDYEAYKDHCIENKLRWYSSWYE